MSADPLLDRSPAHIAKRLRRHLDDIVDSAGLGVAAAACGDMSKSDLRQALDGAPGRYVRLDMLVPILRLGSSDARNAFLTDLLALFDLMPAPKVVRSPSQRLADLEDLLETEFGDAGKRLVSAERSRP
jgi:hypothetical protein